MRSWALEDVEECAPNWLDVNWGLAELISHSGAGAPVCGGGHAPECSVPTTDFDGGAGRERA